MTKINKKQKKFKKIKQKRTKKPEEDVKKEGPEVTEEWTTVGPEVTEEWTTVGPEVTEEWTTVGPEITEEWTTVGSSDSLLENEKKGGNAEEKPQKKRIKGKAEHRTEPSQDISEFNLTEIGKEKVKLVELIKSTQKSGQLSVKKQLQKAKKLKSLSIPLSKPQLQKIKRTINYEKVCGEVSKWSTIVKNNRDADQIVYPLKRPEFHLEGFESASEKYISKHPVEEAVSKILQTSENVLDNKTKSLTPAEEKALQAMSLEEAKLRHGELMKHRALISYQEAKARRKNKIKSKRYHRILKREKLKQMMKEFEELQKTDQHAALEKFIEADKLRIVERMTLKHRNTGKWAKQHRIRAKYNPESRSVLKEDLLIGRQLREKVAAQVPLQTKLKDSEIDPEDKFFADPSEDYLIEDVPIESESVEKAILNVNNFVERKDPEIDPEDNFFADTSEDYLIEDVPFESESVEKAILNVSNFVESQTQPEVSENTKNAERNPKAKETVSSKPVKMASVADEMAFSSEVSCLNSMIPDHITFGDDDLDDGNEDKITISQAFADEEFIAEFQEEKKAADRANRPAGIDLFLPGWGSWGGPNIKASRKKRRRFFIKPLEQEPKKNTVGNVIINEENDKKASEHQVSHMPFPFSNVHQFKSYIRQPIGHTWNPQSSFQNLTAPKVITKMGKVIDPIDPDDVVFEKKKQDIPIKKKRKKSEDLKPF